MLFVTDIYMLKARKYIESLGHVEDDDPARFETLVRAAYEDERKRGHILIKNSGLKRAILKKAIGMEPRKRFEVKRSATAKGKPIVGGWGQGKRPDQKAAIHGQIMAVGKDGVVLRDDKGRRIRVRHEHLMNHAAPLTDKEWPKAAKALADAGEKVDPVSRFMKKPGRARLDAKAKRQLNTLGKKFKELDVKRVLKEASVDEVNALIGHYKKQPLRKSEDHSCQCEHVTHFDGSGHEYGKNWGVTPVQTSMGKFYLCDHCFDARHGVIHVGDDGRPLSGNTHGHIGPGSQFNGEHSHPRINSAEGDHWHTRRVDGTAGGARRGSTSETIPDQLPDDIRNMKSRSVWRVR